MPLRLFGRWLWMSWDDRGCLGGVVTATGGPRCPVLDGREKFGRLRVLCPETVG